MARADAAPRVAEKMSYSVRQRYWSIIFILLLLLGLVSLGLYLFSPSWTRADGDLPVGLRSPRKANYAMDPRQYALPPLNLNILGDALADRSEAEPSADSASQLSTLLAALHSPVPSITPLPGSTQSPTQVPSPTEKIIPTWLIYTGTAAASPTAEPSATPTRVFTTVPTITPPPFFTATIPFVTVVPVYPTLTPTVASSLTPTKTMVVPTQAASKTAEPTKGLITSTPKTTATPALTKIVTLSPSPEPSATTGYPPPQETTLPPTAYP